MGKVVKCGHCGKDHEWDPEGQGYCSRRCRFYSRVGHVPDLFACWEWKGRRSSDGYGAFRIRKRQHGAHRVAYELAHGSIPRGMIVCHRCDNPPCVRPDHLFLGTDQDDTDDKVRKGRQRGAPGDRNASRARPECLKRGEDASNSKLTEAQVRAIRAEYDASDKRRGIYVEIAKRYPVTPDNVSLIARRKNWRHVKEDNNVEG